MTKKILFFVFTTVFIFTCSGILLASDDYIASEIRYKLDGGSLTTVDIDDVTIAFYLDGVAHAPVALHSFSEPLEGTITEMDLYLTDDEGESFWFCATTEEWQTLNQYYSGDGDPNTGSGIAVTNNTAEIYVGMRIGGEEEPPTIVSPGTE